MRHLGRWLDKDIGSVDALLFYFILMPCLPFGSVDGVLDPSLGWAHYLCGQEIHKM